jgi:hypothetical protein
MSSLSSATQPLPTTTDYTYCFIPSEASEQITELRGDGAGGLGDDQLTKNAKKYFSSTLNLPKSDSEKAELAASIRADAKKNGATDAQLATVTDDALLTLHTSTACEITALTIPCAKNDQTAVSMYSDDKSRAKNLLLNVRATALARGCGHGEAEIYGDCFVSRYYDDEVKDIWNRVDLKANECTGDAKWCKAGGGGAGGGSGNSLSSLMAQQQAMNLGTATNTAAADPNAETEESNYSWTQNSDEVEIKIALPANTPSNQISVKFSVKSLKVQVSSSTVLEGSLGGAVMLDDCTYTVENDTLLVVLGKQSGGSNWSKCVD